VRMWKLQGAARIPQEVDTKQRGLWKRYAANPLLSLLSLAVTSSVGYAVVLERNLVSCYPTIREDLRERFGPFPSPNFSERRPGLSFQ
jgi:hypothetical protein